MVLLTSSCADAVMPMACVMPGAWLISAAAVPASEGGGRTVVPGCGDDASVSVCMIDRCLAYLSSNSSSTSV